MNVNLYVIEDYKNETALMPKKQSQNKPNFKRQISVFCFPSYVFCRPSSGPLSWSLPPVQASLLLCRGFSVLCFLMQPKLLNFHRKNSLTVWLNSVELSFL